MTTAAKMAAYYSSQRDARMSFWLVAAGAVAGVFQLYYPYGSGPNEIEFGAGFEMLAIARNVADHGAFANPFLVAKTGPTAVVPPIYPLVPAALTWLLRAPGIAIHMPKSP